MNSFLILIVDCRLPIGKNGMGSPLQRGEECDMGTTPRAQSAIRNRRSIQSAIGMNPVGLELGKRRNT